MNSETGTKPGQVQYALLANYEASKLDPEIDAVLKAFLDERRAVLPDSFA